MKTITDFINEKIDTSKLDTSHIKTHKDLFSKSDNPHITSKFDTSHVLTRDELIKRSIKPTKLKRLKHLDDIDTSHVKTHQDLFNK